MKNDNYHLRQLNRPVSQIDIQRNIVGFVVDGHIIYHCKINMNGERHYLVVISVAKCSDGHGHYVLPQISLPSSDVHYSYFTMIYILINS